MIKIRHTRSDGSEVFFKDELLHLSGLYEALADERVLETDHMDLQGWNLVDMSKVQLEPRVSAHTFRERHVYYGYNVVGSVDTLLIERGDRFYIAYANEPIGSFNVLIGAEGVEIHEEI